MSTETNGPARASGEARTSTFTPSEIDQFIRDGFVRIDNAFATDTAAAGREILWGDTGCDPNDRATWTKPVIRLWDYPQQPFRDAVNTPVLYEAFDALVGKGRWVPRESLGTFPIRFPHSYAPGDTGWHVDASFAPDEKTDSYFEWRVNLRSKGRALLMLFLFSDVGGDDAPTRIRIGSHMQVARLLAPAGESGMPMLELSEQAAQTTEGLEETIAVGKAGTVYLCHPFLLHAAQAHRGKTPKFMAQPPLFPRAPFELNRADGDYSPVERAIRQALRME